MRWGSLIAVCVLMALWVAVGQLGAASAGVSDLDDNKIRQLVEDAFKVKVSLRSDQRQELDKVKRKWERPLREAYEKKRQAELNDDETKKIAASREILRIRNEISDEIEKILATPDPAVVKKLQEAQKRMEQAQREARERARQQKLRAAQQKNKANRR